MSTSEAPAPSEKQRDSQGDGEPYNPFEHRNVMHPTTDYGALAHMLKASLGSGILAMPMAFRNSGLVFGTFGSIVLGVICTHCIYLLVRNSQVLCSRFKVPTLTFPKTAEKAFECGPERIRRCAKTMGVLITVQLLGSFILGNTVYVVFMSQSINQLVQFYAHKSIDVRFFSLMLWIPLIAMCMLRDLKALVPFSIVANIFVTVSLGIILYYIFRQTNRPDSVYLIAPFSRMPLFLTTVIFAIEGIGTVLTIENEMEHPEHFIGGRWPIAYISMAVVVFVYGLIGFFGYLEYGESTQGSITLNLPVEDELAETVKILVAAAIFFTYALQFYVPINLIYDMLKEKIPPKYHLFANIMIRIILVSITVIVAVGIPNLEPIIGLVGAICFSTLGLLMPALIDTMTRYPYYGRCKYHMIKNIFIAIIAVVALTAGTYSAVVDIIYVYVNH